MICLLLSMNLICAPPEARQQQAYYGPRNVEQVYIRTRDEVAAERKRIAKMKLDGKG